MKFLWAALIAGQILSAGNMNYQQEAGYHEINPIYTEHPSKQRVYWTKAIETGLIFGATELFPKHEKGILIGSNVVCWGFIISDRMKGISFSFSW